MFGHCAEFSGHEQAVFGTSFKNQLLINIYIMLYIDRQSMSVYGCGRHDKALFMAYLVCAYVEGYLLNIRVTCFCSHALCISAT